MYVNDGISSKLIPLLLFCSIILYEEMPILLPFDSICFHLDVLLIEFAFERHNSENHWKQQSVYTTHTHVLRDWRKSVNGQSLRRVEESVFIGTPLFIESPPSPPINCAWTKFPSLWKSPITKHMRHNYTEHALFCYFHFATKPGGGRKAGGLRRRRHRFASRLSRWFLSVLNSIFSPSSG